MNFTGRSGGAAGPAPSSRTPIAITPASATRLILRSPRVSASSSAHPCARAHGGAAVAELLRLHRLALAAVRDRIEPEVRADGVDVHQVVACVRLDPAVAVHLPQLAIADLVDLAGRDPEVLPALRDGRDPVADHVVAAV